MSKKEKIALFLFADYYDATTSTRRVLAASKGLFDRTEFLFWSRLGDNRKVTEDIYKNIEMEAFAKTAKPRSIKVLLLFMQFQFWIFKRLLKKKPKFVVAFTFYTIFPTLLYKYLFNRKCMVIYDPRDYVAVSFRINKLIAFILNFVDNIFIKLSNFVIFPDRQYFVHYGKFKLSEDKYLILPNSAEDVYDEVSHIDVHSKYNFPKDKHIIPVLGYFSETRGQEILFNLIKEKHPELYFVFAGDLRDEEHLSFFKQNADNVTFIGKIPYIDAAAIMKNSLLVPQLYDPQLLNNVYALPTKYYDCLMIGTPVVVSKGQLDVAQEVVKHNFGWSIGYTDTKALREIILNLIANPEVIDKSALRKYFLSHYDYRLHEVRLRHAYHKLLDRAYKF